MSRTRELRSELRSSPLIRHLVPQEAALGWPFPESSDAALFVSFIAFGALRAQGGGRGTDIYPPLALLTVRWPTGEVVEYRDLRARGSLATDGRTPIGRFPHRAALGVGGRAAFTAMQAELFGLYDVLLNGLAAGAGLESRAEERMRGLFAVLLEPALLPAYRALAPRFSDHFLAGVQEETV